MLQTESRARRHEHLAQRRRGDAVDEPGERLETVLHGSLVALQAARRDIAVAQGFVHDFGAELAAVHRQEHTARKHRVDERVRIPNHDVAVAGHARVGHERDVGQAEPRAGQVARL